MLSPPGAEGASLPTSAPQDQGKGKEPVQEEGPSGEQENEFVLLQDDETDAKPTNAELGEIIQEQQSVIENLSLDLERAKWIIKYLEQRNNQLEDQQAIMELQNIRENRQAAQRRRVEFTSLEQEVNADRESWLERVNVQLERKMKKAINENNMLRNLSYHYLSRNLVCQVRIRNLKAKVKRVSTRQKEDEGLKILAEAFLAHHST